MNPTALEGFLEKLAGIRILVVGDLMLDEYLWGTTDRISPEAPVQVVDIHKEDLRLGGAGNVIHNLQALGCGVETVSVVGGDEDGLRVRELLASLGKSGDGLILQPERKTSRKTRILASSQQMMRIDRESRDPISPDLEKRLLACCREKLGHCQCLLVSDYGKGVVTEGLLRGLIPLAGELGVPVLVDPKGKDYGKYRGATLLTPNRKELLLATGLSPMTDANLRQAGRSLVTSLDLEVLALTRSEEGMTLFFRNGEEIDLQTRAREVFDVSGAGDTVLALMGAGLGAGLSFTAAAKTANLAAGIVVGKVGTSTVRPEEILEEARRQWFGTDSKVRSRESLARVAAAAREAGKTVVFTNGCFDLLHVGHVRYLQQARQLGDLLILGLNSDASVRRLKGDKRPLIGEAERAHILAALSCVDYVTIFEEDTPLALITALRPDILAKGGDYTPESVVGRELVEGYGGRVEIIRFVEGRSTTDLINRILERY
jgi:D-beta-D-heptose 7-phosphate kinase/D-beta-D-heptose 1-phosphate adenosyltransferase